MAGRPAAVSALRWTGAPPGTRSRRCRCSRLSVRRRSRVSSSRRTANNRSTRRWSSAPTCEAAGALDRPPALRPPLGPSQQLLGHRAGCSHPDRGGFAQTAPYPGFATDWQPPLVAALTQAQGVSAVHETVFEDRLGYAHQLSRMGATIQTFNDCLGAGDCRFAAGRHRHSALVAGPTKNPRRRSRHGRHPRRVRARRRRGHGHRRQSALWGPPSRRRLRQRVGQVQTTRRRHRRDTHMGADIDVTHTWAPTARDDPRAARPPGSGGEWARGLCWGLSVFVAPEVCVEYLFEAGDDGQRCP